MRSRDRIATRINLALESTISRVDDRGSYRVVITPSRPSFYGGNSLLLDDPPTAGDLAGWWRTCQRSFPGHPIERLRLEWETGSRADGGMWPDSAHLAGPAEYTCHLVMQLDQPPPPRAAPAGLAIRALTGEADWDALTELSIACFGEGIPAYAEFCRWHLGVHRDLARAPGEELEGVFFGAWDGDTLAGALGLYRTPHALRFQEVQTHADYRRRGVCSALCTHALHQVWNPGRDQRAIIVAVLDAPAATVYRKLGFVEVGLLHELTAPLPAPG